MHINAELNVLDTGFTGKEITDCINRYKFSNVVLHQDYIAHVIANRSFGTRRFNIISAIGFDKNSGVGLHKFISMPSDVNYVNGYDIMLSDLDDHGEIKREMSTIHGLFNQYITELRWTINIDNIVDIDDIEKWTKFMSVYRPSAIRLYSKEKDTKKIEKIITKIRSKLPYPIKIPFGVDIKGSHKYDIDISEALSSVNK